MPIADADVTDEMLKDAWNALLESLNDRPAVYQVLAQDFKRKEYDIVLTLSNPVQESLIAPLRSDLDTFLRTRLNNSRLRVTWELGEVTHEQLLYGSREKFEHLVKKNPALKELKDRFNLDPDFD